MFHPDYNSITDRLPLSLVKRAYHRLLHHSRNPIPKKQISEKCDRIEDYLRHTLNIYENSLDRRRKTIDRKKLRSQSWPECPTSLSYVYIADKETQADNNNTCNHEEEIKRRVIKELDIIYNHLLEYNRDNFGRLPIFSICLYIPFSLFSFRYFPFGITRFLDSCKTCLRNMRNGLRVTVNCVHFFSQNLGLGKFLAIF